MKNIINYKLALAFILIVITIITVQACKTHFFRSNYLEANVLLHETSTLQTKPFLKAHLDNGDVCIFKDTWQVDSAQIYLSGEGTRYDFNRDRIFEGKLILALDSIAIFETNNKILSSESSRIAALTILTALDVILGIVCITNPKACFGSCPTFYINEHDDFKYADAEGFSNAISPTLEYFDIDALNNEENTDKIFSITMKNEALETHCVKDVKLYAYPRSKDERIYQFRDNDFYLCKNYYKVNKATDDQGDITNLVNSKDREERFSLADEYNLISREEIFIDFNNIENAKDLGLIINFRQTLMTTYFIYSAIGYMGDEVGDIFAKLEIDNKTNGIQKNGIREELGDIDIFVWNDAKSTWLLQNGFYETGPIAFNQQILPLSNIKSNSSVKLKVVLNKGLWRIDHLALTNIIKKVDPLKISPDLIFDKGIIDNDALSKINNEEDYLISMPGSEYKFVFTLPEENQDYELFLYSKGYYLEWMRESWIKDKDLFKLREMIKNPKQYLRTEGRDYKQYETTMEDEFWNSKIDTKTFSYYEN